MERTSGDAELLLKHENVPRRINRRSDSQMIWDAASARSVPELLIKNQQDTFMDANFTTWHINYAITCASVVLPNIPVYSTVAPKMTPV